MSIKTDTNSSLQSLSMNEALRPEVEAGKEAVLPRHSPVEALAEKDAGGSLGDNAPSLPKVSEADRHLALWEKQIKETEKQIQNLEDGKKDRGWCSWLVGADSADDKALDSAKSH